MDEARTPMAAAARRAPRWRSPWLVTGVPAAVLVILTINVLVSGPLIGADQTIRATVQAWALSPSWQWIGGSKYAPARAVVDLADPSVAVPELALIALAVSARCRSWRPLVTAAVAALLLTAIVIPAKILIGRPSPGLEAVPSGGLGAFPSGHTTTASVCLITAVLLVAPLLPGWLRRLALAALPLACLAVGAALVWCDFHWFTDVVAGWALAVLIVQAAGRLTGAFAGKHGAGQPGAGQPGASWLAASPGRTAPAGNRPAARTPG